MCPSSASGARRQIVRATHRSNDVPSRPPGLRAKPIAKAKPSNWTRRTSRHDRGYGTAHAKMRERVLREEPLCRICDDAGLVTATTTADHIMPLSEGGTGDRDNMQGLCGACHRAKTAREAARARLRRRQG
jgi:5-methylcytosine-specific restriction protein A